MSAPIQPRLAVLAARRTSGVFVVLWTTVAIAIALQTRPDAVPARDMWGAPHFGFARQHVWSWFLLGVAPLLVLRAVRRAAPMQAGDAAWLATRGVSNATIALSTWTGVFVPWCLATCAFALFADTGAPHAERVLVECGRCAVPTGQWFETDVPLKWSTTIPGGIDVRAATFELGIGAAHGGACEVNTTVTVGGAKGSTLVSYGKRMSGRSELEIAFEVTGMRFEFPVTETPCPVEFRLECVGEGARALILSPHATLWKNARSPFDTGVNVALLLVLAGAAWSALALAFACFVGSTTAACGVLALWIPVWMSDWPLTTTRWIPGASLFDALEIVGSGRAPAAPTVHAWMGTLVIVVFALALQAFGLSRWRVSR